MAEKKESRLSREERHQLIRYGLHEVLWLQRPSFGPKKYGVCKLYSRFIANDGYMDDTMSSLGKVDSSAKEYNYRIEAVDDGSSTGLQKGKEEISKKFMSLGDYVERSSKTVPYLFATKSKDDKRTEDEILAELKHKEPFCPEGVPLEGHFLEGLKAAKDDTEYFLLVDEPLENAIGLLRDELKALEKKQEDEQT